MKAFGKYCFIILAGCAIGLVMTNLDARGRFIPQRLYLNAASIWHRVTGRNWPASVLKPTRVEVERGVNLLLDPGDMIGREILTAGVWELEVWQSISDGLSAGAVFLDVGAHIGYYSLKASVRVGEGGKVISFEPNPRTLEQLRANIVASRPSSIRSGNFPLPLQPLGHNYLKVHSQFVLSTSLCGPYPTSFIRETRSSTVAFIAASWKGTTSVTTFG